MTIKSIKKLLYRASSLLFITLLVSTHAQAGDSTKKVYELRTYHTFAGKLPELQARFRDHTHSIFTRLGMKVATYWIPIHEPDTLIYIIEHDSEDDAKQKWQTFIQDPQWVKAYQASIKNGKLVESIDVVFMQKADFSPDL